MRVLTLSLVAMPIPLWTVRARGLRDRVDFERELEKRFRRICCFLHLVNARPRARWLAQRDVVALRESVEVKDRSVRQ